MRYLVLFMLAGLLAWPHGVAAQNLEEAPPSAGFILHAKNALLPQRTSLYLYLDADADIGATSDRAEPALRLELDSKGEIQLDEPVSSPAQETEAPDIDTLSQRSIEHYETQHSQSSGQRRTGGRSPGAKAGIAVGVILGVGLVGFGIGAAVAMSNWEFEL